LSLLKDNQTSAEIEDSKEGENSVKQMIIRLSRLKKSIAALEIYVKNQSKY